MASDSRSLRRRLPARQRRGMTLVLVAMFMVPLMACVALAIDLGLMSIAQTQLNDAADAAALAGARALNGNSSANNNYSAVSPAAQQALSANTVLGTSLQNSQLSLNIGRYAYNSSDQQFEGQFPGTSGTNWNLVQATATATINGSLGFSRAFNFTSANLKAVSSAAHRPRDICIILDYSGSMRFGSLLGLLYYGNRTSNNLDTVIPVFGAYSSSNAGLLAAAASSPYENANISTTTSDGRPPIVQDFYTSATGGAAFSPAASSYATTPGGDNCLKISKNTGTTYAQTLAQVLNIANPTNSSYDSNYESTGYRAYSMTPAQLKRYTVGPNYWGKTFFVWPPDPSLGTDGTSNDWRKRYFTYPGSNTPMDDNSRLWDSNGNWLAPGNSTYAINYNAILNFISNIGPNPFPTQLQSGRILYYNQIPTSISTSTWPPTDLNQRFWKDYIDYVLGVSQTGSSSYQVITDGTNNGMTGYGVDFSWGNVQITPKSNLSGNPKPFMHYGDNPQRPQLHFWFGPMTMVDFLGNYNLWYTGWYNDCTRYCWWPGTCHESPLFACKLGISAALTDINNNHPNDFVSMIMFSTPLTSSSDTSASRFNRVRVGLGQNQTNLQESLWYPPATLGNPNATVTPYDSNNLEVPRAMGGTCYAYPLMLAYNQFSGNSGLQTYNTGQPAGDAGGNGRKGAQKIIIFETDGAPNTTASANFVNNGNYQSYYSIRYNSNNPSGSEYPSNVNGYNDNDSTVTSQIYSLCTQLAAADTANGYSATNHPLLIHCLAFGPQGSNATATLNQMQQIGNVNDGMPSYKIINGTESTVVTNLQTAIAKILQTGVQVSLIQ
jgi:Flp pilus assembly protein TadG